MEPSRVKFEVWIRTIGYAGLAPIIVASLIVVAGHGPIRQIAVFGLIAYCAITVSCLGAVNLGHYLLDDRPLDDRNLSSRSLRRHVSVSILPALFAFIAMFLPSRPALLLLATIFAGIYCYDRVSVSGRHGPGWFVSFQSRLSLIAIVSLVIGAYAI